MLRTLLHLIGYLFTLACAAGLLARFIPPDVFWPPAIIALLLPGLLIGTGIYSNWVLIRREWGKAVLPVIVILVGIPLVPQLFAFGTGGRVSDTDEARHTLKLLTTNMRHFIPPGERPLPVDSALRFVHEVAPDILLLQEIHLGKHPAAINAKFVEDSLGLPMRHQADLRTSATFSKKLSPVAEYYAPRPAINGIIVTDTESPIGPIRIINVHLQSNKITDVAYDLGGDGNVRKDVSRAKHMFRAYANGAARRAAQAETVRKLVRESPLPVIVGGDFNDVPSSYTYRRSLTPRLKDAWVEAGFGLGATFTGPLPGLRIDFLLVDTSFTVEQIERIETGFSDHRGLAVTLSK